MTSPVDAPVFSQIEAWHSRREFGRILYTCDKLLKNPAYAKHKAEILMWKGRAHLDSGFAYSGQAVACFKEGLECAKRNRPIKAALLVHLSCAYTDAGDYQATERLLHEWEALAGDDNPDVRYYGLVLIYHHAVNLDNSFQYEEAARMFQRGADMAREGSQQGLLWRCLHNLGGVKLAMGHVAEAERFMLEAEAVFPSAEFTSKRLSRRAEYNLAAVNLDEADRYVQEALGTPNIDNMTRADVHFTWAQILRLRHRWEEAQEKAFAGLEFAVKAVHYPGIHKINRFLQQGPLAE